MLPSSTPSILTRSENSQDLLEPYLVEKLLEEVRGVQGAVKVKDAQRLLDKADHLRKRSIEAHDAAHGSAIDRERERLLATGLYGAGARR